MLARAWDWMEWPTEVRWGRREAGEVCSDSRLWPFLGFQNGQGAGRAGFSLACQGNDTSSSFSSSADAHRSAFWFLF